MNMIMDCILDALIDSAKLIPFLAIIYILLEFIDRKSGTRVYRAIRNANKLGPLLGGGIGVIPQCGLSAAAATLFSRKVISVGTMMAVFLSASDDMIPIFISESVPILKMVKVLACKMILGIVSGYLVDLILRLTKRNVSAGKKPIRMMSKRQTTQEADLEICTAACCRGNFWLAVLKHVMQVTVFVFAVSVVLNVIIASIGEDKIGLMFKNIPVIGQFIASLIGLIPNCASSVVITQLYLSDAMTAGAFIAGLLVNAGVGLLTLVKFNKDKKQNLYIIMSLYGIGVFWGLLIDLIGITF